jgi:TPR repeat protein
MRKASLASSIAIILLAGNHSVSAADWYENLEDHIMDGAVRVKTWTFKNGRGLDIRCFKASNSGAGQFDLRYSIEVPLLGRLVPDLEKKGEIRLIVSADGVSIGAYDAHVVKHDFGISFLATIAPEDVDKLAAATKKLAVVPRQQNEPLDDATEFGVDGLIKNLVPVNAACEKTRAEIKMRQEEAAKGNASAMVALGDFYTDGTPLPRDISKGVGWYEKAATVGDTSAMNKLGTLYLSGIAGLQDFPTAREWLEKAAAKNDPDAMAKLGDFYLDADNPARDWTKARGWYENAAVDNNVRAMFNLGVIYEEGKGVRQDLTKAGEWYEKAASRGSKDAGRALEKLKISKAETAGNFIEAVRLQTAIVERTEAAETKELGKSGAETADALSTLAWFALFAKDFAKAVETASKAVAIAPTDFTLAINLAHAKMFSGQKEDAEKIYLSHKGEKLSEMDNKLWQEVIAEDFTKLRKAGLAHPLMRQIEHKLGISKIER